MSALLCILGGQNVLVTRPHSSGEISLELLVPTMIAATAGQSFFTMEVFGTLATSSSRIFQMLPLCSLPSWCCPCPIIMSLTLLNSFKASPRAFKTLAFCLGRLYFWRFHSLKCSPKLVSNVLGHFMR